jgi:ATP-dependent Clp protease adapter protein ClpS
MPNHRRYDVVLLNDHETPMEFLVRVLEVFFDMSFAEACTLMFRAHEEGKRSVVPSRERKPRKGSRHSDFCRRTQISAHVYF